MGREISLVLLVYLMGGKVWDARGKWKVRIFTVLVGMKAARAKGEKPQE